MGFSEGIDLFVDTLFFTAAAALLIFILVIEYFNRKIK